MMDSITMVVVVSDKYGVNAAAVFGSLPYCQECIRYSLDNAAQLSEKAVDDLKKTAFVTIHDCQLVRDDKPQGVGTYFHLSLSEFLQCSEESFASRYPSFNRLFKKLRKEGLGYVEA